MIPSIPNRDSYAEFFRGKRIMVTGGTGSFGNQIIRELLEFSPDTIVVYSRDEKKQYDMQDHYTGERRLLLRALLSALRADHQ